MELGYINGRFVGLDELVLPIDERGHQFGDGVYEVIRFYDGKPFMLEEHLERLIRSAKAIKLPVKESLADFTELIISAVEKSEIKNCNVYLQITRGIATRNHLFPDAPVSITMTVRHANPIPNEKREKGVDAITHPDERWANCYIKSLNLLPNILAKQTAFEQGCHEAILIKDGYITEGTSSNVYIVQGGEIITTPLTNQILPGITRMAVKKLASELNIPFVEKHFTTAELMEADEIFITSTTAEVLAIVKVDGNIIGSGTPGEVVTRLHQQFQKMVEAL
ncbi:D-amino-acid transaminase [Robertmurraya andreesenii]|uniref:D-alanine aminotransferase n=1 Tax=Anoxybacillus andreesenii TaxID=1325932 RepID=A0ABT9V1G3_9BACL|nr:D-amino-acid transaminase [Robertmurraya andreesenii]MDQ0154798.1 D-alanine transaminase [Robertmurraya andreesenii]